MLEAVGGLVLLVAVAQVSTIQFVLQGVVTGGRLQLVHLQRQET